MSFPVRDVVAFPVGSNPTDVLINDHHFNRTTLDFFNYTLYSNGTLSNISQCYLVFNQYTPLLLENGTFVNGTSCFSPINEIRTRGALGIVFGALFALTIIFTLTNLRKHGRTFLPRRESQRRCQGIGRRRQWYWMLFVAACGIISSLTAVDVDRYYLPGLPLILQGLFYYLMLPSILACVWESVRNWSSLLSNLHDATNTTINSLPSQPRQMKLTLPLLFHLTIFLTCFLTVPRSWTPIQEQRSPSQTRQIALPAATDFRFKAGCLIGIVSWLVICYAVYCNMQHHRPRPRPRDSTNAHPPPPPSSSPVPQTLPVSISTFPPPKILLALLATLPQLLYTALSTFMFAISPLNLTVDPGWPYGLGYAPCLLALLILNVSGAYFEQNDDRVVLRARAGRAREADGLPPARSRPPVVGVPTTMTAAGSGVGAWVYADDDDGGGGDNNNSSSSNERYGKQDEAWKDSGGRDYEMTRLGKAGGRGGRGSDDPFGDGEEEEEGRQRHGRCQQQLQSRQQQQQQQQPPPPPQQQQIIRSMLDV